MASKKTKKAPKFNLTTVNYDDMENWSGEHPDFVGFVPPDEDDVSNEIEKFLLTKGWSYEGHWFSSDSDAGSHSAYAVLESVNKGHTQGLIVDTDDDDVYFYSR